MEVRGEDPANPGCSSSTRDRPGVPVSKELLTAGSGGRGGIWDKLLITAKPDSKKATTLQTVRVERSPLLEQVQSFLPQMAQANEKLREEMAAAPPGHFNIENTDGTLGKVIQMSGAGEAKFTDVRVFGKALSSDTTCGMKELPTGQALKEQDLTLQHQLQHYHMSLNGNHTFTVCKPKLIQS